jgi:AAA domain/Bifunctional DNA primase/polymerase, N-terminal
MDIDDIGVPSNNGFDPDFAAAADWARLYRSAGVQIVPCKNKVPRLKSWKEYQNALVPDAQFEAWYGPGGEFAQSYDMGALTGTASGHLLMIDLDIYKAGGEKAARWWADVVITHNNRMEIETWRQTTGGGGIQMFFTYPPSWKFAVNAKTDLNIDVRCQGGFAVLPPTLHASGKSYAWDPGCAPWEIDIAVAPDWLLEEVEKLIREHGGGSSANVNEKQRAENGEPPFVAGQYDAFGHQTDGRETFMRDLVWGAVVDWRRQCPIKPTDSESAAKAREKYQVYEREVTPRLADPDKAKSELLDMEGRGLTEFWRKWSRAMELWDTKVAEEAKKPGKDYGQNQTKIGEGFVHTPPPQPLALRSAFPIVENEIPVRDWIVPGLLLKRNLSVLVAPPASGKSLLTLQLAIAVALGLAWGGWFPRKPEKVLVINAEDDFDEMRRRLFAAAKSMGVNQADLVGKVLLAEAPESIVIAKMDSRSKSVIRTPLIEDLVATIVANDIGLVIADPFAETFEGDENSNSEVKWAGILWREVARRIRGSLLLVHHTKKYAGDMAGNADASRGGGALIGTARILSTLFTMTEDEAKLFNIPPEERDQYVRFDDAKANHSAKGRVKWFRKITVSLNNGTGLIAGDDVGVLDPWQPPGIMDGVTARELGLALETIDRGVLADDGRPTGQLFGPTVMSKDRFAGRVLEQMLGIPEERAKQMIKAWLESGALYTVEYDDPQQRKPRTGVKFDRNKRPDGAPEVFE